MTGPAADQDALPRGRRGWLRAQLPRAMAEDPFIADFVQIFERIADSLRAGVDSIEHQLDTGLAAPPMLRYLAGWVGVDLDPGGERDSQRELIHAIGPLIGWRGTRRGLEGILQALTGGRAHVQDGGGVFRSDLPIPPPSSLIRIELDHLGELTEAQVRAFVAAEVPVGARVELVLARADGGAGDDHR